MPARLVQDEALNTGYARVSTRGPDHGLATRGLKSWPDAIPSSKDEETIRSHDEASLSFPLL